MVNRAAGGAGKKKTAKKKAIRKKAASKGGRPGRVLTDKEIIQVEALSAYLTQAQIAAYMGITERTFANIMERQDEVLAAYKKGKAKAVGAIAQNVVKKARDGNVACMFFYLKTQAGWRETSNVDVTTDGEKLMPAEVKITIAEPSDVAGIETPA